MAEARLASGLWVAAYLARLQQAGLAGYVMARGDDTAGAVLVKCATLDGQAALWAREYDMDSDTRDWRIIAQGPERDIDESMTRQRRFDPDLWLIEVESRSGDALLTQEGLG